jgi:hypothetical protein
MADPFAAHRFHLHPVATWMWQMTAPPQPVHPPVSDLRPCGCRYDPAVFGHFRPHGCQGQGVVR